MNKGLFVIVTLFASLLAAAPFQTANAQIYGTRVSNRQVNDLLVRIETKTDTFRRMIESDLDHSTINNTNREDRIADFISEFETATDSLRSRYNSRQNANAEAQEVLNRAAFIDRFMTRNSLPYQTESQWTSLRADLDMLARYYTISWNWNRTNQNDRGGYYGGGYGNRPGNQLTGTYRLDIASSDNVTDVVNRSLGYYTTNERERFRTNLERRLSSPEMIAIDQNGRSVTIASSLAPQVTFSADGVARTETNDRGRTVTTRVTSNRDGSLAISYQGERANDFNVTFAPAARNELRVTRRIWLDNQNREVSVTSVYDKIDNVAQWSTVNTGSNVGDNYPNNTYPNNNYPSGTTGDFYIPNGTRITAQLANRVDSRASQVGDRFTLEVTSPAQYRGAVIEGRIVEASNSGRVSGRANLSFDFDTIRMTNGQSYRFAGIIDSVRASNGDNVSVSNEGTVRDSNQTTKTATRAGVGAALGALIGAIAGGGQGAAIGAAIGAGAGAGTVLVQGRDSVVLESGTEFNITSSGPNRYGYNR